jgi:hypothetical protein
MDGRAIGRPHVGIVPRGDLSSNRWESDVAHVTGGAPTEQSEGERTGHELRGATRRAIGGRADGAMSRSAADRAIGPQADGTDGVLRRDPSSDRRESERYVGVVRRSG